MDSESLKNHINDADEAARQCRGLVSYPESLCEAYIYKEINAAVGHLAVAGALANERKGADDGN